jgi:lysine biosynthesis protein LysW
MNGTCPVCDAAVSVPANTEVSEILTCGDCQTRVVVQALTNNSVTLGQAPAVEEDWGE